jgi:hypothetical protein
MKKFLTVLMLLLLTVGSMPTAWGIANFQQYTQAVGLYRSGSYPQAYQQFSSLMKAHPEDVRLPYYLGLTAVRLGKIEQAKRFYETVITIAPKSLVAPYAKQGLALLVEAETLDAPIKPHRSSGTTASAEKPMMPIPSATLPTPVTTIPTKPNTLVAQWQKTHPTTLSAKTMNQPIDNNTPTLVAEKPLSVAEPAGVISTIPPKLVDATPKEIGISPAMLAVSPTGSAGVAPTNTVPASVAQTPAEIQAQQQQQMMQTMMMMQMMGGSGGGNSGSGNSGGNSNPMAMMLPMMMMQQQQQQNPAGAGGTAPANPFSGIDPKMMSDMMTQGMMNNLDLFSDSKKDNN